MQEKIAKLVEEIKAQSPDVRNADIAKAIAPDLGFDDEESINQLALEIDGLDTLKKKELSSASQDQTEPPIALAPSDSGSGSSTAGQSRPPKKPNATSLLDRPLNMPPKRSIPIGFYFEKNAPADLEPDEDTKEAVWQRVEDVAVSVTDFNQAKEQLSQIEREYGVTFPEEVYGDVDKYIRANKKRKEENRTVVSEAIVFAESESELDRLISSEGANFTDEEKVKFKEQYERVNSIRNQYPDNNAAFLEEMVKLGYISSDRRSRVLARGNKRKKDLDGLQDSMSATFQAGGYDEALKVVESTVDGFDWIGRADKKRLKAEASGVLAVLDVEKKTQEAFGRLSDEEMNVVIQAYMKRRGVGEEEAAQFVRDSMESGKRLLSDYIISAAFSTPPSPDFDTQEAILEKKYEIAEENLETVREGGLNEQERAAFEASIGSSLKEGFDAQISVGRSIGKRVDEAESVANESKARLAAFLANKDRYQELASNPDYADALSAINVYRIATSVVMAELGEKAGIGTFAELVRLPPMEAFKRTEEYGTLVSEGVSQVDIEVRASQWADELLKEGSSQIREYILNGLTAKLINDSNPTERLKVIERQMSELGVEMDLTGGGAIGYNRAMFSLFSGPMGVASVYAPDWVSDFLVKPTSMFTAAVADVFVNIKNSLSDIFTGDPTLLELKERFSEQSFSEIAASDFQNYEFGEDAYGTVAYTVSAVAQSAPSILAAIGATAITKNPSYVLGIVGAVEASSFYSELRKMPDFYGLSGGEKLTTIAVGTVPAVAASKIFGSIKIAEQLLGNSFRRAFAESVPQYMFRMGAKIGLNAGGETFEEIPSFLSQEAAKAAITGDYSAFTSENLIKGLSEVTAVSSVTGVGVSTIGVAMNSSNRKFFISEIQRDFDSIIRNTAPNSAERVNAVNSFMNSVRESVSVLRDETNFADYVRATNIRDLAALNGLQNRMTILSAQLVSDPSNQGLAEELTEVYNQAQAIISKHEAGYIDSQGPAGLDVQIGATEALIRSERGRLKRLLQGSADGTESPEAQQSRKEIDRLKNKLNTLFQRRREVVSSGKMPDIQTAGYASTADAETLRQRGYKVVFNQTDESGKQMSFMVYDPRNRVRVNESLPVEQRMADAKIQAEIEQKRRDGASRSALQEFIVQQVGDAIISGSISAESVAYSQYYNKYYYDISDYVESVEEAATQEVQGIKERIEAAEDATNFSPEDLSNESFDTSKLSATIGDRTSRILTNASKRLGVSISFSGSSDSLVKAFLGTNQEGVLLNAVRNAKDGKLKAFYDPSTKTIYVSGDATTKDVLEEIIHATFDSKDSTAMRALLLRLRVLFSKDQALSEIMAKKRLNYGSLNMDELSLVNEEVSEVLSVVMARENADQNDSVIKKAWNAILDFFKKSGMLSEYSDDIESIRSDEAARNKIMKIFSDSIIENKGFDESEINKVLDAEDGGLFTPPQENVEYSRAGVIAHGRIIGNYIASKLPGEGVSESASDQEVEAMLRELGIDSESAMAEGIVPGSMDHIQMMYYGYHDFYSGKKEESILFSIDTSPKASSREVWINVKSYKEQIRSAKGKGARANKEMYKAAISEILKSEGIPAEDIDSFLKRPTAPVVDAIRGRMHLNRFGAKRPLTTISGHSEKIMAKRLADVIVEYKLESIKSGENQSINFLKNTREATKKFFENANAEDFGGQAGLDFARKNENLFYTLVAITSNGNTADVNIGLAKYIMMSLARNYVYSGAFNVDIANDENIRGMIDKITYADMYPGVSANPNRVAVMGMQLHSLFNQLGKESRSNPKFKDGSFNEILKDLAFNQVEKPSRLKSHNQLMDWTSLKIGSWAANLIGNEQCVTQDAHYVQFIDTLRGIMRVEPDWNGLDEILAGANIKRLPTEKRMQYVSSLVSGKGPQAKEFIERKIGAELTEEQTKALVRWYNKNHKDVMPRVPKNMDHRAFNEAITNKAAEIINKEHGLNLSPAQVQQLMFEINHDIRDWAGVPRSKYSDYSDPILNDRTTQSAKEIFKANVTTKTRKTSKSEIVRERLEEADRNKAYMAGGQMLFSFTPGESRVHGTEILVGPSGSELNQSNLKDALKRYPLHSAILDQGDELKDGQKVFVYVDGKVMSETLQPVVNVSKTLSGMPFHVTDRVVLSNVSFPKPSKMSFEDFKSGKRGKMHLSGKVKQGTDSQEAMTGVLIKNIPLSSNGFVDERGRVIKSADEITFVNGNVIARGNIEYYPESVAGNGMFKDMSSFSTESMNPDKAAQIISQVKGVLKKYFPESYTDDDTEILDIYNMLSDENKKAFMNENLGNQGRLRRTASRSSKFEEFSDLKDDIVSNPNNYIDPKYTSESKKELAEKSIQELVSMMRGDKLGSLMNRNDDIGVLAGIELINRMRAEGREAAIPGILEDLARMGTSIGRLLRQFGELKSSTPFGIYSMVTSMAEKQGKTLNDKQKTELQTAAEEYMDAYRAYEALMERAIAGENVEAEMKAAMDRYLAAQSVLDTIVNKTVDKTWSDIGIQLIQGNLLTSMSQAKNIAYNIAQLIPRTMVDVASYPIEKLMGAMGLNTSQKRLSFGAYMYGIRKFGAGWVEAVEQVATGRQKEITEWRMDRGFMPVRSLIAALSNDLPQTKNGRAALNSRAKLLVAGTFGIPAETMFRLLSLGDIPFRRYAEATELYHIAQAKGLKGEELSRFLKYPDKETMEKAKDEGARMTFQKEGGLAKGSMWIINNIAKGLGKMFDHKGFDASGFFKFFIRSNVPYVSTIANFMEESLTYISPAFGTARVASNIMKKDGEQAAKNMTKVIVGQVFTQATIHMIANGIISSSVDWRDDEKTNLMYDVFPPNSINISALKRLMKGEDATPRPNDVYKSYQTLGIMGSIMGAYAKSMTREAAQSAISEPTKGINMMKRVLGMENLSLISYMMDQSFMQGLNGLLEVITEADPEQLERAMEKYVENMSKVYSAMVIPNFFSGLNMATREFLPDKRDVHLTDRMLNHVKERTFNTDGLPVRVNWKGERITQAPLGGNQFAYYMFDPYKTATTGEDPTSIEILKIYLETGKLPKVVGTPYFASSVHRKIEAPSFNRGKAKKALELLRARGVDYSFIGNTPDDFRIQLDAYELNEILALANPPRYRAVSDMMKTPQYMSATNDEKIEMLDELNGRFNSLIEFNADGTLMPHSMLFLDIFERKFQEYKNNQ